jgi:hypothetical protein
MRKHLVDLLYEEYKQKVFFKKVEASGLVFSDFELVDNWSIVLDFIGFPKENEEQLGYSIPNDADTFFSRTLLYKKYVMVLEEIDSEKNMVVSEEGLIKISGKIDAELVKGRLASYVDWLFDEYEKLLEIAPC